MNLIKLIIFVLALRGSKCHFGIIKKISDRDKTSELLAESAVSTLLSCYDVNTVGAVEITEPKLQKLLLSKQSLSVIFFSDNLSRNVETDREVPKESPHKIQLFVIEAPSQPLQIRRLLLRAVLSQKSGNTATYLIIDWPSQKNQKGCSNAHPYLLQAWRWSIMNAFYVCLDKLKDKMLVYSYNPYTSQAPAPWQLNGTFKGINNDHPWSLFIREYRPGNQNICSNLNFVKTHDLGGYYVRCMIEVRVPSSEWTTELAKQGYDSNKYGRYILEALNATPDLYLYYNIGEEYWNSRTNITFKPFGNFYDMFYQLFENLDAIGAPTSSRIMSGGLVVVTQHKGEMSQLDKLIGVLDRSTRIGLCLVALKTLLFFKYFMRQPLGTAVLNVCRIITNTGLVKVPKKSAPRLYLAGVFILVVTIVGIYSGLIASLLTKPTPLPDINTMKDLMDSPHKIYMHPKFARYFTDQKFNGRLVLKDRLNCTEYVERDAMAACVNHRIVIVNNAIDRNLHISRDVIVPMYFVYLIKLNWDLEERVNEIIGSLTESHIDWYIYDRPIELKAESAEYKKNLERNRPRQIKLTDLGFAFAILGIGLGLSTVAFIVELALKRA